MRVLHYLDRMRLEMGGVVRAVLDLCGGLAARGHDVMLVTRDDRDVPEEWKLGKGGVPRCIRLTGRERRGTSLDASDRRLILDAMRAADVVHLHGMWTPSNVAFAAAARSRAIPYVLSPHGMLDDWSMAQRGLKKRLYLRMVGRQLLDRAAAVHCTAQAELEQARKWFRASNGVVVPLLFDLAPYRQLPGPELAAARFPELAEPGFKALFLSRLHPKKGPDVFLRAAAILRDRGLDARFLIAGSGEPGYAESLQRLARDLRLEDRVRFLGLVVGAEKVSLYQAADAFVLPTAQENFGFVFYEAMAAGTPVITTHGVDTWEEISGCGGARIIDRDKEQTAAAIGAMMQDPSGAIEMGRAGREWVLSEFAQLSLIARYEDMYRRSV